MPAMFPPATTGRALTIIEDRAIPEFWADGAVVEDDGEVIRIACFSTARRGGAPPVSRMALRVVMPPAGFAWSLGGVLSLPVARRFLDALGRPMTVQ